ncbi:MAG: radical SAM protein [Desulfobacterales bacterium]|nr:radical SAM protein [Desulfobacterales bacterium]
MLDRVDNHQNPKVIHLMLTRACNLSCIYCHPDRNACGELSASEWKQLIDRLTETYGRLTLLVKGGEPMLRKDLMEILRHIKSKGHKIFLITNGTLILNEKTARRLETCVDHVEICLDGISPETTDPVKGEGVFERAMTGIKFLHQTRVKLGLSFVIQKENKSILWEPLEDFMKEHLSDTTPVRIDNRLNSPVNFDRGAEDLFDFLRAGDKLACHGRLGKTNSGEAFEIDADGCFHPYAAADQDHRHEVKTL